MNQKEFTKKCQEEKLTDCYVRYDNGFSDSASILGCTKIGDLWYIYETDEVGNKLVHMISDKEEKTFSKFYDYVIKKKA